MWYLVRYKKHFSSLGWCLDLSAVRDLKDSVGTPWASATSFKSHEYVVTSLKFSEDYVIAIEPWTLDECYEELGTVSVWTCICHAEQTAFVVFKFQSWLLVWELRAVDWNSTGAVTLSKVTSLRHEVNNYAMEDAALVRVFHFVVASAKWSEVFSCLWAMVFVKLNILRIWDSNLLGRRGGQVVLCF